MQAADVMTTRVVTVLPETSVREVARVLLGNRISAVPVVDREGRVLGMLSEGDLMRRVETGTDDRSSWWLSLLYLAAAGSVLTFACFLTLQRRIGPGPTSTIGVMTPLLALVVSMLFENFRPVALTFVGAALAFAGNFMILRRSR